MSFNQITVVGSECMGVSIALGLRAIESQTRLVLFAPGINRKELAHARGLFDTVARGAEKACREADLVVVAQPLNRIESAFNVIAPHLKRGCFVTDTAPLKVPVLRWAKEQLPEHVHFLGGHPFPHPKIAGLVPPTTMLAASPALLKDALYCFTAPDRTSELTIQTFSEIASSLGAEPFFVDQTEHDGFQAAVDHLPRLLALALLRSTVTSPAWRDIQKLASYRFATGIEAATTDDPADDTLALLENRENTVRRINLIMRELAQLRDALGDGDVDNVAQMLIEANNLRAAWLGRIETGLWTPDKYPDLKNVPSAGQHALGRLLFGEALMRRLDSDSDRRRED